MQAIWVLENIKGDKSFYNELDSLLLLASVGQFRTHNNIVKDFILYCDQMTKEHIYDMNAQNFFTDIKILPKNNFIDKSVTYYYIIEVNKKSTKQSHKLTLEEFEYERKKLNIPNNLNFDIVYAELE